MKKIIYRTSIIAFAAITVVACKKHKNDDHSDDHDHGTTPTATISITSLNEGDTIQPGTTLHINGTIASSAEMHGYQVIIHNHTTMMDVFTKDAHEHATSYSVHEHWTNNVADTSLMHLKVTGVIDHSGNKVIKTINFVCLP